MVRTWQKPITIARHAYGDVYKAAEIRVEQGSKAELTVTTRFGGKITEPIYDFECGGVLSGQYNKDSSIESFARSCFAYALSTGQDLWFSAKDTIAKKYDGTFRDVFQKLYEEEYKALIDDAVARVIRSEGGFIWALKNYDGDVMSDMVSTAFGSLAMMTSVLVSPEGNFEYEAAHGTVTRHYYKYLKGEETSTNPIATIFAWSGALRKRGEKDGLPELMAFADRLENSSLDVIRSGVMTGDLCRLWEKGEPTSVTSAAFLDAVAARLG